MNFKILLAVFCLAFISASAMTLRAHQGSQAWYTFDQGPSGNRCSNSNQCDGQRTCSDWGWCQGTSRPPKNADYIYNEVPTGNKCPADKSSPNYANRNYYCDGNRTCSQSGWCQGTSRQAKSADYKYNEALTGNRCPSRPSDPNYANRNFYCDGNRTCSQWGWCQGTSR